MYKCIVNYWACGDKNVTCAEFRCDKLKSCICSHISPISISFNQAGRRPRTYWQVTLRVQVPFFQLVWLLAFSISDLHGYFPCYHCRHCYSIIKGHQFTNLKSGVGTEGGVGVESYATLAWPVKIPMSLVLCLENSRICEHQCSLHHYDDKSSAATEHFNSHNRSLSELH